MDDTRPPEPADEDDLGIPGITAPTEVGRGGFAIVYRARQEAFDRDVAVKVLNSRPDPTSLARFEREVKAMGSLGDHPQIVPLFDAGLTADGKQYLLMPYLPGGSYQDLLDRGERLSWSEAVAVGADVADGLAAAHDDDILHRDLKPANILLDRFGNAKLADFGIARIAGGHETTSGVITASIAHAPPEILDGRRPSVASDIYGLASTIYALTAGHAPFVSRTDESVLPLITRIMSREVPPLEGVPSAVDAVLRQAMAKLPGDRPASAAALAAQLRALRGASGPPAAPRTDAEAGLGAGEQTVILGPGHPTVGADDATASADGPPEATEPVPSTGSSRSAEPVSSGAGATSAWSTSPSPDMATAPGAPQAPTGQGRGGPSRTVVIVAVTVALVSGAFALAGVLMRRDADPRPDPTPPVAAATDAPAVDDRAVLASTVEVALGTGQLPPGDALAIFDPNLLGGVDPRTVRELQTRAVEDAAPPEAGPVELGGRRGAEAGAGASVSHVLFGSAAEAQAGLADLLMDRLSFEALAEQRSIDADTAGAGGLRGSLLEAEGYSEAFTTAALAVEVSELSDVVETDAGFHLLRTDALPDEVIDANMRGYGVDVPADGLVRITVSSEAVDPIVVAVDGQGRFRIADDDLGGGDTGADALLDVPVETAQRLRLVIANLDDEPGPVQVSAIAVEVDDLDAPTSSSLSTDRPIEAWRVVVGPDGPPTEVISMAGETFDSWLRLVDDRGVPRASSRGGTDAAIDLRDLEPGTYTLIAGTDDDDPLFGSYDLTFGRR